jgi:hypothetical protein
MPEQNQHDRNEMTEYRLTKLEEGISSLNTLKEVVLRWDVRFSNNDGFLQCPMHKVKMDTFEIKMNKMEEIVTDLDRFKWKAVGVLSIIMLLTQLFGTTVVEKYFKTPAEPIKIQWEMPSSMTNNIMTLPTIK